jgi:hypothetical protein
MAAEENPRLYKYRCIIFVFRPAAKINLFLIIDPNVAVHDHEKCVISKSHLAQKRNNQVYCILRAWLSSNA